MATYRVTDPQTGRTIKLTGDSPPNEKELEQIFSTVNLSQPMADPNQKTAMGFANNAMQDYKSNIQGQAELASYAFPPLAAMKAAGGTNIYDPQRLKMLGQGIVEGVKQMPGQIAQSVLHPIESGYKKPLSTALDIGTAVSLASQGARALKPIVTSKQLESLSGSLPGTLEAVYEKPSLMTGGGKKSASAVYQSLKEDAGNFRQDLMFKKTKKGLQALEHKEFVNNANNANNLTPIEALEARKSLDKIKKSLPPETFNRMRDKFDTKAKEVFAGADQAYKDAIVSESARSVLPQNKYGGTSAFKIGIQTALSKLGDEGSGIVGNAIAATMSPAVQSTIAAGAGTLAKGAAPLMKAVPALAISQVARTLTTEKAKEFLKKAKNNKEKATQRAIDAGYDPYQ